VMSPELGEIPADAVVSLEGVARLSIVGSGPGDTQRLESVMRVPRETHVIVIPRGIRDPVHHQRDVLSVRAHMSLDEVLTRLT
jgi:hypothetical protein